MQTVFDTEQWNWRRAYKPYQMGGLSNVVQFYDREGNVQDILAVIPTAFVKYLRDIHGEMELEQVGLYAGPDGKKVVFGYMCPDNSTVDLWSYSKLPAWLNPAIQSVTG